MDKEQARFVLRSFRPDGADVGDQDFADALALAAKNRELGEWLARERSLDAAFASALVAVELPQTLRDDILGCLAGERGDFPQAANELDAALIGALASIQPPPSLRGEILSAMDRSALPARVKKPFLLRLGLPLAAAAGVALAFLLTRKPASAASANAGPLPVNVVEAGFIRTFESPLFNLDTKRKDHRALLASLKARSLPCPCSLPPGLANVAGVGCRELTIDGKRGSLICFDEREAGVVHLVVFSRKDVSGELPRRDHPAFSQNGRWAVASWQDDGNAFVLIGNTDLRKLAALF